MKDPLHNSSRTCIQCGKSFIPSEAWEPIPICPLCKNEKTKALEPEPPPPLPPPKILEKNPAPQIPLPEISKGEARSPFFRSGFSLSNHLKRRYLRSRFLLRFLFIALFAVGVLWFLYRSITFPHSAITDPTLHNILQSLTSQVSPPSKPFSILLEEGKNLLFQGQPNLYPQAAQIFAQALLASPTSHESLTLLAETYGRLANLGMDPLGAKDTALELSQLSLRLFPKQSEGTVAKAYVSFANQDYELTKILLKQALTKNPNDTRAQLLLARVLLDSKQENVHSEKPLELALEVSQKNPSFVEGHLRVGQAYFQLGRPLESIQTFEKILRENPHHPSALFWLGNIEERAGNQNAAKEWYYEALRENSAFVSPRLALALILSRKQENLSLAEYHLREILSRYRTFASNQELLISAFELSRILFKTGRTKESAQSLRNFPNSSLDTFSVLQTRLQLLRTLNETQKSLSLIRQFIQSHPFEVNAQLELGISLDRGKTSEEAIQTFQSILSTQPEWLDPYVLLTRTFFRERLFQEGFDVARQALQSPLLLEIQDLWAPLDELTEPLRWSQFASSFASLANQFPDMPISIGLAGFIYLKNGIGTKNTSDLKKALALFLQAYTKFPSIEFIPQYIGRTYFELGNWPKALQFFQIGKVLNPSQEAIDYWIGKTYLARENFFEAERNFKKIKENSPWRFLAQNGLGDLELAKGNVNAALSYWKGSINLKPNFISPWKSLLKYRSQ